MSNSKQFKTIGFGINNELLGGHTGIFINVTIDSVTEQLILNDDGSYDLEVLKLLLSHKDSSLYKTGEGNNKEINKEEILKNLMGS